LTPVTHLEAIDREDATQDTLLETRAENNDIILLIHFRERGWGWGWRQKEGERKHDLTYMKIDLHEYIYIYIYAWREFSEI
jgi:hypothetical protein